jgi:hypothetical protein
MDGRDELSLLEFATGFCPLLSLAYSTQQQHDWEYDMQEIDNYQDILDVRDIIDAYELASDDGGRELLELLDNLSGNGGDHQWQGDWYPVTLIRDSYFTDYAEELANDIGLTDDRDAWPYTCIDWERAARELRMDYTSVEYDGVTYWYR